MEAYVTVHEKAMLMEEQRKVEQYPMPKEIGSTSQSMVNWRFSKFIESSRLAQTIWSVYLNDILGGVTNAGIEEKEMRVR